MTSAIIVAAGMGTRMGPNVDKLFLGLNGRPVAAHTWQRIEEADCVHEIIVVVRDGMQAEFKDLAGQWKFIKPYPVVHRGEDGPGPQWNGVVALAPHVDNGPVQDQGPPRLGAGFVPV